MRALMAAFARNTVFANIVLVLFFLAGGIATVSMIREIFPQFSLDMITVIVAYPGADPEEVEEGISRKIEEALEGVDGIKQINTTSSENVGTAMIEVKENYEVSDVLDRVRSAVDGISTFPVDAEKPITNEIILRGEVAILALSGDMSERRLKEWAENVKDEFQMLPEISQVEIFGIRDYEIAIEISEEKLRQYNLRFDQVANVVRRSNLNMAGGTIRTEGEEIRLRTMGRKYTGEELASIVVLAEPDGDLITLAQIAEIDDGFTQDPIEASMNGRPAVFMIIFKTEEEDGITISNAVDRFLEQRNQELPEGVKIEKLIDTSDFLRDRINLLVKNGIIGLIIVLFLLWIFLDIRLSFWAGMGMPISVAGALAILWASGGTLNMISLFGLIMVLGIIVDDAIVVGEAIYVHRRMGKPPLRAAVDGVSEVGLPVIAAVTTTIVAFLPLMFVGGIMGKFIFILPVVVIACLAISLIECLILLPAHLSHLPDPNQPIRTKNPLKRLTSRVHEASSRGLEWFVANIYKPFLKRSLKWRYVSLSIAIAVMLITIGLFMGGFLKFEVFASIDGDVITALIEFPSGTPPEVTRDAIDQIESALMRLDDRLDTRTGEPLVKNHYSLVGQTLEEMAKSGPNVGSVQANLLESADRGIHSEELMVLWEEEVGRIPGILSLRFAGMEAGPPGAPIEIWIQGEDMDEIIAASEDLMDRLRQFEGVYQIRSDFVPGKNEIRLQLKPEARTLGLTVADLAQQINAGYYGEEALRIQRGRDDVRVKVRYTEEERSRLSDLEQVRIRTLSGYEVPLMSVADFEFSPGYSSITRTDGMRRVSVSAEIDSKRANANEIFGQLEKNYFPELKERYRGIYLESQGEKKKMRESLGSLFVGFPLAIIGIFIIIATIFRSYIQPFVIMFTVPFGIIGATWGHLLFGYDLSLMSTFGMVALTGVVVNDAIVMIECINSYLAEGRKFMDAVVSGGVRRFRAVLLTTFSTVGGLTPLILETDMQARFLIPMALAIAAGVAFATVLTLLLIPSLLVILNDLRRSLYSFRHFRWPTREEVEPATERGENVLEEERRPGEAGLSTA